MQSPSTRGFSVVLGALLMASIAGLANPRPVAAFTFPQAVKSWYMDTVSTSTLYDMGCTLGNTLEDGSAPQFPLVILDFGQPSYDTVKGYGAWAWNIGYVSTTQIRNAVVEYAHGFWNCTDNNFYAHVAIGVGTSNYQNWSKNAGFSTAMVEAHARAWGTMMNDINQVILNNSYNGQAHAVAAADIEVSWGGSTMARDWVDQYDGKTNWSMFDYGDAAGCRQSGTTQTAALCGNTWYQDDLYYVAWGASVAYAVPEIYREDGAQAKQWQQISKWATLNAKSKIYFEGTLTQHAACAQQSDPNACHNSGIDNTAAEGWNQLIDRCATDSATALTDIKYASDIKWH